MLKKRNVHLADELMLLESFPPASKRIEILENLVTDLKAMDGGSKGKGIDVLSITRDLLSSKVDNIKEGESDEVYEARVLAQRQSRLAGLKVATDGISVLLGKLSEMRDFQEKSLWNLADALDFIANYGDVDHYLELASCRKARMRLRQLMPLAIGSDNESASVLPYKSVRQDRRNPTLNKNQADCIGSSFGVLLLRSVRLSQLRHTIGLALKLRGDLEKFALQKVRSGKEANRRAGFCT